MLSLVYLFLIAILVSSIRMTTSFSPHRGTNRLFLDTAVQSEWEALLPIGIFHGITTNPTLLERAGLECTVPAVQALTQKALSLVGCDEFMCQAWGCTSEDMYNVGMQLSEVDRERVVIKVPVTFEGTKAASKLIDSGVRVCLTACYSSDQAIIAAGLGAEYLAPYLGRMTDAEKDGMEECRRMQNIANGLGSSTRILVASIRNVLSMGDLMAHGMDTFTFNPEIARKLFTESLTKTAAADFEAAAKRCGGE